MTRTVLTRAPGPHLGSRTGISDIVHIPRAWPSHPCGEFVRLYDTKVFDFRGHTVTRRRKQTQNSANLAGPRLFFAHQELVSRPSPGSVRAHSETPHMFIFFTNVFFQIGFQRSLSCMLCVAVDVEMEQAVVPRRHTPHMPAVLYEADSLLTCYTVACITYLNLFHEGLLATQLALAE